MCIYGWAWCTDPYCGKNYWSNNDFEGAFKRRKISFEILGRQEKELEKKVASEEEINELNGKIGGS